MANAAPAAAVGAVDAALLDVVRTAIEARHKQRWSRAAELFERAATRAAACAPADSLITAGLRVRAALALSSQAQHSPDDPARLLSEGWALTAAACRTLSARDAAATLLPPAGLRADELAFARAIDLIYISVEDPEQAGEADYVQGREADAVLYGYEALLRAAQFTLVRLLSGGLPPLPAAEADGAHAFVLRALALIREVEHTFHELLGAEIYLVKVITHVCASQSAATYRGHGADAAFYDELVQSWNRPETQAALVAHGTLAHDDLDEMVEGERLEAEARRAADIRAVRLRPCALPSCAAIEVSVRQFKVCGACKEVAYCCAEHAKAHWKSGHKQACNAQNNA